MVEFTADVFETIIFNRGFQSCFQVKAILRHLRQHKVELPAGGVLTPGRFLQLGLALGRAGGFESLHYLLENAFDARENLSFSFLREVCGNVICLFFCSSHLVSLSHLLSSHFFVLILPP